MDDTGKISHGGGVISQAVAAWQLVDKPEFSGFTGTSLPDIRVGLSQSGLKLFGGGRDYWLVQWRPFAETRLGDRFTPVVLFSDDVQLVPETGESNVGIEVIGHLVGDQDPSGLVLSVPKLGEFEQALDTHCFAVRDSRGVRWAIYAPTRLSNWPATANFVEGVFFSVEDDVNCGEVLKPQVIREVRSHLSNGGVWESARDCLVKMLQSSKDSGEAECVKGIARRLVVMDCPLSWAEAHLKLPCGVSVLPGEGEERAIYVFLAPKSGESIRINAGGQVVTINGLGTLEPVVIGDHAD